MLWLLAAPKAANKSLYAPSIETFLAAPSAAAHVQAHFMLIIPSCPPFHENLGPFTARPKSILTLHRLPTYTLTHRNSLKHALVEYCFILQLPRLFHFHTYTCYEITKMIFAFFSRL
jgi:hypothetical protein